MTTKIKGSVYWQTAMVCQQEVIGRPFTKYMNGLPITSNWQTPYTQTKRTTITALQKIAAMRARSSCYTVICTAAL